MKLTCALVLLATLAVSSSEAASTPKTKIAPDCTQAQRQLVNKLLQQDVNPAKACYSKAKGDIPTLSTSRLCPIPECRTWLKYMAENSPDCVYDDTNYGRDFTAKSKDCGSDSNEAGVVGDASASAAGSDAGETPKTPKPTSRKPSTVSKAPLKESSTSGSGSSSEIEVPQRDNTTIEVPETPEPEPTTSALITKRPTPAATPKSDAVSPHAIATVSVAVFSSIVALAL
ncbi:hypothetical protein P43SY_008739 [Pythium insidiosum]|uniref:Elicitin-like protein n=1 Tax=Pythium insidiosum TaxID=114742 RepID=A0AAD5Q5R9_PYTIN|nr:hypothetical protein P43SY_008739 [Pythium insidiosum]